jgi:hypothetical protein
MKIATLGLLVMVSLVGSGAHAQTTAPKIPAFDATFNKVNVIAPIGIPAELGSARDYQEELVESYVRSRLIWTGNQGYSVFRPNFLYMEFRDTRTGKVTKIYLKDQFTLVFSNGSTVKVEFLGPFAPSTNFFQILHGSEKTRTASSAGFFLDHPTYNGDPEHEWPRTGDPDCGKDFHICGK